VGLGANAYQGKTDFTGSLVSFGFDFAHSTSASGRTGSSPLVGQQPC